MQRLGSILGSRTFWTRFALLLVVAAMVPACGGGGGGKKKLVTVALTSPATTSETNTTATFTVVLSRNPTANVTIDVTSLDPSEGLVSAGGAPATTVTLTFTPANGTTPQTVTVTGQDDALVDGDVAYVVEIEPAVSADAKFNNFDGSDVNLTNLDDDVAPTVGITVTPTTVGAITEGGQATFDVSLDSAPVGDVTVDITITHIGTALGDLTVGAPPIADNNTSITLTLNAGNMVETVVVKAVDDVAVEGTETFTITTGNSVATDPADITAGWNGLVVADVTGNSIIDNDGASLVITPTTASAGNTLITSEAGTVDTFQVRLGTVVNDVTVTVTVVDTTEGEVSDDGVTYGNSVILTFTSADSQTFQTVFVRGKDDTEGAAIADTDQEHSLTVDPVATDSMTDGAYDALANGAVFVVNVDLDGYTGSTPPGVIPGFSPMTPAPGIPLGGAGAFDEFEADHPSVLMGGESGSTFEMWYRGRTKLGTKNDAIGQAVSNSADGTTLPGWVGSGSNPVLQGDNQNGSWIRRGVGRPAVVVGDFDQDGNDDIGDTPNTYIMFFSGRFAGSYSGIAYVTSPDGINWTTPPSTPDFDVSATPGDWDDFEVTDPTVIFDDTTNTFHIWYAGSDGTRFQIGYLTADLSGGVPTNWQRQNGGTTPGMAAGAAGKFDADGVSAPTVIFDGTLYRMYFTATDNLRGRTTIGYAEASDPEGPWTKFPAPVLLPADATSPATWANQNVFAPSLIKDGFIYRIWYSGTGTGGAGIGYVEVDTTP